ncbi:MAG: GNAT family N-acetyltransferase [Bacteroidota bacterium]
MQYGFLTGLSLTEVNRAFNRAFEHYFVPVQSTLADFQARILRDDLRLNWSTGAFIGDELVGLMLHGYRDQGGRKTLYNGGTGVATAYRGKGLTQQQYDFLRDELAAGGIQRMQLEVMRENAPALHVYKKVGFEIVRELDCFAGRPKSFSLPRGVQLRQEKPPIWRSEPAWESYTPSWQHADASVRNLWDQIVYREAVVAEKRVGYLLALPDGRVMQYAVAPEQRGRGIGKALFSAIHQHLDRHLNVINVQRLHRPLDGFFIDLGLQPTFYQYEMVAELP